MHLIPLVTPPLVLVLTRRGSRTFKCLHSFS